MYMVCTAQWELPISRPLTLSAARSYARWFHAPGSVVVRRLEGSRLVDPNEDELPDPEEPADIPDPEPDLRLESTLGDDYDPDMPF
jgi:hypothetical protein